MDDLFRISKLIELLLYGLACIYLGHQWAKPPEQRHYNRLRKPFKKRTDADVMDVTKPPIAKSLDVCNRPDDDTDLSNLG